MKKAREKFILKAIRWGLYKGWWEAYANKRDEARVETEEPYKIAKKRCKARIKYRCDMCGDIFRANEMKRDHIIPIKSGKTLLQKIKLALCSSKGLQNICKECHDEKTKDDMGWK